MNRVTITLHIDLPDGVVPDVSYGEEPPPYDPDEQVVPVQTFGPMCPQHGKMTRYPAGVNKAGKPYNASWRCDAPGCPTKPQWDRDAA